ncbi:substrate-binding domain-containing protein [Catenulispora rubra]|uniref:substrate-binding domain-containing protein n=1 Tax=Catenulispora rubra TaxID=280293 RepID=UPI001891FD26|nr:substrate-binding domain-containing protein [Catenulispora rubra]
MRSVTRKLAMTSAVAAAALGAVMASNGAAMADPASTPAAGSIVAVGSDTIQSFDNGLSTQYNGSTPTPASKFYSWDATGTSPITPKTGCDTTATPPGAGEINRPNGSGSGITALNNTDYTCVDIARSSRPPNTGTTDYFIPFASDAVGWSAYTGGNAPSNLTSAELKGIYNCTYTTWNSLPTDPTSSTDTIKVYVPQSGSGTRSFFLNALGITATSEPCWQSVTPEENEGTDAAFTGNTDAIFPYSLSHYVGQVYDSKGGGSDLPGSLDAVRSLDSTQQILTATKVWNNALSLTYTRNVFHVVREADWNGTGPGGATEQSHLKALLDRSSNSGYLCTNGASLITSYGFQTLSHGCGTLQPGV